MEFVQGPNPVRTSKSLGGHVYNTFEMLISSSHRKLWQF